MSLPPKKTAAPGTNEYFSPNFRVKKPAESAPDCLNTRESFHSRYRENSHDAGDCLLQTLGRWPQRSSFAIILAEFTDRLLV